MKKGHHRSDKKYQTHSSFDFQETKARIWAPALLRSQADKFDLWMSYLIVGVLTGVSAFVIDLLVEEMVLFKWEVSQEIIVDSLGGAFFVFLSLSVIFGAIASLMTVYVGPGAMGSGTAELMAYLNGINYPKFIGYRTLAVKIVALSFAVGAGLCVGKEGPLAHIGAIIGHATLYMPFRFLSKFRNEWDKREIACAGAAAGVSAAFGSPIGGSLFIYEVSRPSTFWSF